MGDHTQEMLTTHTNNIADMVQEDQSINLQESPFLPRTQGSIANDCDLWRDYWRTRNQPWRTEPEIDVGRGRAAQGQGAGSMKKMNFANEVDAISRAEASENILPLLLEVLNDLHRQGIAYCYWKSSRRVRLVLAGKATSTFSSQGKISTESRRCFCSAGSSSFPRWAGATIPRS